MFLAIKNTYLIHILLKNYNFFGIDLYNILHIPANTHLKIWRVRMISFKSRDQKCR